jgi:RNA polymerase sigma-70 factor (ECF subfamily)
MFMKHFSDEQLVKKYLEERNERALEFLIKRYLPLIYGFVRRYTGNEDNASDITQEVFVKVWRNLERFDQSKSFRTWIFTIAKRTAIDWLRKKRAVPFSAFETEGGNAFLDSLVDDSPSLIEQLSLKENSKALAFALAQLPQHYNSIIRLRLDDNLSFREIAGRVKEPVNTVKSRYRRGAALLKDIILKKSSKTG